MWNAVKAEFKNILHNRLLLISTTVICIIPFLYSIFFLKSVWDPYGSTENLPVAVVNKDVPVEYRGQTMDVGNRMVKQLRKNKQLKWEIVSSEKAHYGLTHRKYYTVVTIPKDFSKDATTVLDKHPQQMQLKYETNGSLNYIGQVISEVGMTKLNEKIRAQVTQAYATAMFKALHTVGKGMSTAANGAQQLSTGLVTLQSGTNQYVAGVSQVNNGVQTLRVSVAPLTAGAQQLASGSQTLANGIRQYTGGVGQLAAGLSQLNANSGALNSGASQLQSGLGQLSSNSGSLKSGAAQVAAGNAKLNSTITTMLPQIQNQMGAMSGDISAKGQALNNALTPIAQTGPQLKQLSSQLGNLSSEIDQIKLQVSTGGNSNHNQSAELSAAANALNGVEATDKSKQQAIKNAQDVLNAAASASSGNSQQPELVTSLEKLQSNVNKLQQAVDQSATGADQSALDVKKAANDLQASLNSMQTQTGSSLNEISGKLPEIQKLTDGAAKLNAGVNEYTNGVDTAAAGAGTLTSGINQYTAGVAQAGAGVGQLTANSGQLNSGAGQLAGALGQLNGQVPALTAGVNQLAAGTQQLVDNSPALVQGIIKLNAGASKLSSALGKGAKTINGIKTSPRTAKMIAEPSVEKHTNYSYVPNYGHALAPYVLSVALYVGMLVFNFVYPIRRVADRNASATAWWFSKVVVGGLAAIAMAVVECGIMMMCGLTVEHVPSFFTTTILFGLASVAIVMFLSMTFDNPGRFVAMVLLMLQLGGSGGTFPMEVTMKFYNVIHWYLPMTYSILGLRDSISGGLGAHYTLFCNLVLLAIAVVFNLLLLLTMKGIASHEFRAPTVESMKANQHGPMGKGDGFTSDGKN
ncbi:YhgE/Pip domain-containing protein [Limosilactobacillus fastidiosus]|uniref:YhgE/Pip domain-containing protein n=1 Tax=Limosilactobacillus fastidiosus TaxID=2759855 RepID=A0A7W3TYX8_9LACO|nr:YhgE/Pip domain-containing protein [Limosilactobacillus fastidiosus]MBB1063440.1 YhgE/Pip domain-containing protein [Limosilactobacillus fastidiosus]MBB1085868.1 YhgE/Pip domain-containing protein [Limosilactobacillus fastidiosus]MCD7084708.1 YhgE/Pip domain-containing protein [Limosilactobacillus fastidiosus]MCD7085795.1 YhgE/Pip domain-containing protein [Limosilactobacillus fastidiosus]MCD7113872.1 YhgE/Pip domain-containing protein [Limosilactobacillus fastidiosus]